MGVKIFPLNEVEPVAVLHEGGKLFLGVSAGMQALEAVMRDIAATDIPVLLTGETGTGKEVVALAIHQLSRRREGRFIKVRCSGLKSETFNHFLEEREGDHTARKRHTIFLDEVSDLDAACQARMIEAFSRLGGGPEEFEHGTCVIATSSRNLEESMQAGQFRQDLYYRLSGVCLKLPPLRQRREDILLLADFFLERYSALFFRPRPSLSPWAAHLLSEYEWPGNVRELENTMKRVVALGDERLALRDLEGRREGVSLPAPNHKFYSLKDAAREASRRAERELILKALTRTRWNRKRAAEELQISYKALLYKLKQTGLAEPTS